jgi:hypothetical protein
VVVSDDLYVAAKSSASSVMAAAAFDVNIRGRAQGLRIRIWN